MKQEEIYIQSTLDATWQPSLFFQSASSEKRPLLVGLHTWSHDRFNQVDNWLPFCRQYDFNLLSPEYRGPNLSTNPNCLQACGSEYAKQDIQDAIDYIIENRPVDRDNIFLLGGSGGGHMALLMAGKCPAYFKAIGAFVPITDLAKWNTENPHYAPHIQACCQTEEEMQKRSPITYIDTIAKANVKIFHGKADPSVPVSHSINLFNAIMEKHPSSTVYLDVFAGGHDIDMQAAAYWILSQYQKNENRQVTG